MSRKHDPNTQCHHLSPRGQHCHLLRAPNHESLCAIHLKQSSALPDQETLAAELLANTGYLSTAREVNTLLGNLVHQFARKRIDRKDAMALAFMSQLLLNSLNPLENQIKAEQCAAEEAAYNKQRALRIAEAHAAQLAKQAAANSQAAPKTPASPQPAPYKAPPSHPVMPEPPKEYADVRT